MSSCGLGGLGHAINGKAQLAAGTAPPLAHILEPLCAFGIVLFHVIPDRQIGRHAAIGLLQPHGHIGLVILGHLQLGHCYRHIQTASDCWQAHHGAQSHRGLENPLRHLSSFTKFSQQPHKTVTAQLRDSQQGPPRSKAVVPLQGGRREATQGGHLNAPAATPALLAAQNPGPPWAKSWGDAANASSKSAAR